VRPALRATYRLQLHRDFGFDAAAGVVPYLSALGISHAYLSPCLTAVAGSQHGYDVADPSRINPELGGALARRALVEGLDAHGMGQIVDIVPNHMAASPEENPWWRDVLENGNRSRYQGYFDIDWSAGDDHLVLPLLADDLGPLIARGDVALALEGETVALRVQGASFPLSARCIAYLKTARRECESQDALLARYNADVSLLSRVVNAQSYTLLEWRSGRPRRNYRRFFDVDSLVGMNVDRVPVFDDMHRVVAGWLRDGTVDGVRVDHIDGLRDPRAYLERLTAVNPSARIYVEKILAPGEALPEEWRTTGTTGYDFLNTLEGLFVDAAGERPLTEFYGEFTGITDSFAQVAYQGKTLVLETSLSADVSRLVRALAHECRGESRFEGVPESELRLIVTEYLARLPVYRTYVGPGSGALRSDRDVATIRATMADVARELGRVDLSLLDHVVSLLAGTSSGATEFALLTQQLSGAVMAKGVEDTAFYRYARLLSLNEVGSDPGRFGTSLAAFHAENVERAESRPEAMLATATHDTKRGEDVRARLDVLSEIPEAWARAVKRWSQLLVSYRDPRLDPNDEYVFYQTVVGAHPLSEDRALAYMQKAIREAKRHTSWTDPDTAYEDAVVGFVRGALGDKTFLDDVADFVSGLIEPGRIVSLSKKLVALTSPGIPDVYQGTELWDGSLVDPDNRRPVDYDARRQLLEESRTLSPEAIWQRAESGLPKLFTVQQALSTRRRLPHAFGRGSTYVPLVGRGSFPESVVAYLRGMDVAVVVPRLVMRLREGWGDTTIDLPSGRFSNVFTGDECNGGAVLVSELLHRFPVALLTRVT
jgi:(1->4)-alpha-D-glucan 1-alpha-D-glucosylmutase